MIVRGASFRDLARIEQLYGEATAEEESSVALSGADRPVPRRTLLRVWHGVTMTISSIMPLHEPGGTLYVAEDGDAGIVGFAQVHVPAGQRNAWQIVNLCVASTPRGHFARGQLLEHICNEGMAHGVHRFHVRVPLDHPLLPVFLEQGFQQYATEQILYRDLPETQAVAPPVLRVARREDVGAIHLLYLRTTPKHVADIEGSSLKAWQAAFANGWVARLGRDDVRHFVAEQPGVVAWVGLKPASTSRPATLALMCDGTDPQLREQVVDAALALLPAGPVACVLRHYDSEVIRALQQRDFDIFGAQLLLVRELAQRVRLRAVAAASKKKPVLARAGLAQAGPTLRVVHAEQRRPT